MYRTCADEPEPYMYLYWFKTPAAGPLIVGSSRRPWPRLAGAGGCGPPIAGSRGAAVERGLRARGRACWRRGEDARSAPSSRGPRAQRPAPG
ncbi:hypothetical protein QJS66_02110 [Kocuria rhizophila]|nr:hypothetical protein QJS66_02110 [Kocuria rhizophila]